MDLVMIVLFAMAVSADGFVVGLSYGCSRIRIPFLSLVVIAASSALAVTASMLMGQGMLLLFSQKASVIGAILIMLVGIYFILNGFRSRIASIETDDEEPLLSFSVRFLGIIVQILKEPNTADMDASGEISIREAFFLGLALALDALGAGVGVAMTGFSILYTAIAVGMIKFIVVNTGMCLGKRIDSKPLRTLSAWIPGLVLLMIGFMELI